MNTATSQITLTWNATVGKSYNIERTHNLAEPVWQPVASNIAATMKVMSWSAPAAEGAAASYYRVVQLNN